MEYLERVANRGRETVDQRYVQRAIQRQLARYMDLIKLCSDRRAADFDEEARQATISGVAAEGDDRRAIPRAVVSFDKGCSAAGDAAVVAAEEDNLADGTADGRGAH